ncbi:MAG TPA: type II toxin-antitoxin system RelE/ParE family toxin [Bryobacteraceae bacterium]|nr:type II toxin-antitoxin system RelE/ParE family toxin [Bryobacteraceae bacterium]
MGIFRLSHLAEADLEGITRYTLRQWGEEPTVRYLNAIEERCHKLAEDLSAGRRCDSIRRDLWRAEQGGHVIFFRRGWGGIHVIRILHQRMMPEMHELDEDQP